jgi:hypothetical protein
LDIRNLKAAPQELLLHNWVQNVANSGDLQPAERVYCGRGFQEARHTAAYLGVDPLIVSAGLGLVSSKDSIPAYNATLASSSRSSIRSRTSGRFNESQWWIDLNDKMPNGRLLSDFLRQRSKCLLLLTLSSAYAKLVGGDLDKLSDSAIDRIRVVGLTHVGHLPERLQRCVMPYDSRFDGPDSPLPGTRSDFPQRATRHFAKIILKASPRGGQTLHASRVAEYMESLRPARVVARVRLTDDEIKAAIVDNWDSVSGSSSRMLRLFRDQKNIACEQGRFAQLFNQVKLTRTPR